MSTEALFQPIQLGSLELKNRIAMSPMNCGYTGIDGYPSDQSAAWYATRAKGGFGLVITECIVANPFKWRGCDSLNPLSFHNQRYYRFHSRLTEIFHQTDPSAKICAQVSPGWGRQGHPYIEDRSIPSGAPSSIPLEVDLRKLNKGWMTQLRKLTPELVKALGDYEKFQQIPDEEYAKVRDLIYKGMLEKAPEFAHTLFGDVPRTLEIKEIHDIEDVMVEACIDLYKCGYDAVELHSPHGYLIHQFLSRIQQAS